MNKHLNYMSVGFLAVELVMIAIKIDFAFSKNQAVRYYANSKTVLNILG